MNISKFYNSGMIFVVVYARQAVQLQPGNNRFALSFLATKVKAFDPIPNDAWVPIVLCKQGLTRILSQMKKSGARVSFIEQSNEQK